MAVYAMPAQAYVRQPMMMQAMPMPATGFPQGAFKQESGRFVVASTISSHSSQFSAQSPRSPVSRVYLTPQHGNSPHQGIAGYPIAQSMQSPFGMPPMAMMPPGVAAAPAPAVVVRAVARPSVVCMPTAGARIQENYAAGPPQVRRVSPSVVMLQAPVASRVSPPTSLISVTSPSAAQSSSGLAADSSQLAPSTGDDKESPNSLQEEFAAAKIPKKYFAVVESLKQNGAWRGRARRPSIVESGEFESIWD